MSKVITLVIVFMCVAVSASAQVSAQSSRNGQEQKHHVDDKKVSARVEKVTTPEAEDNFVPSTSYGYPSDDFKPGVVRVGPRTTYLKEGLTTAEVVRLLGKPISTSKRTEKDVLVTTYEFQRGEGRTLIAEFEQGLLVRSRVESRDASVTQADR